MQSLDCRIQCPISTEHLHLRSFAISDAESRWRLYTDPEIVRYTGSTITREQSDGFLARGIDAFARGEECVLAVCLKGSGDLVGFCGLQPLGAQLRTRPCDRHGSHWEGPEWVGRSVRPRAPSTRCLTSA